MKTTSDIRRKVLGIHPFNKKAYENIDIDRLVAYGMFHLEKLKVPLYFEYIAISLFRLFPKKFSMANFARYPDAYRINNSVRRLAGSVKKEVRWANGSVENGFTLTETGREIAKQVEDFLANPKKQIEKKAKPRSRGRSPADDVADIRISSTFNKWTADKDSLTSYDVYSLLGAMPYAPKELLVKQLGYLKESASTVKDKNVQAFLDWVGTKFNHIFT
jgi:hypothetical protein